MRCPQIVQRLHPPSSLCLKRIPSLQRLMKNFWNFGAIYFWNPSLILVHWRNLMSNLTDLLVFLSLVHLVCYPFWIKNLYYILQNITCYLLSLSCRSLLFRLLLSSIVNWLLLSLRSLLYIFSFFTPCCIIEFSLRNSIPLHCLFEIFPFKCQIYIIKSSQIGSSLPRNVK